MKTSALCLFALLVVSVSSLFPAGTPRVFAASYYVNNATGDDANDGLSDAKPFKTIARGVAALVPGDKLCLTKTDAPYYESLVFTNRAGTPEKPIEIDGRGAVINGSETPEPSRWRDEGDALYSIERDIAEFQRTRFFVLFDGKMVRMSSCGKGAVRLSFKPPRALSCNEWTWVESEKRLYVRLPSGRTPANCRIATPSPQWMSGVQLSGKSGWLVFRNMTAENFVNDGYNIHGHCEHVVFRNIRALYNGDDGISAYETSSIEVDGFYAEGNATGICHIEDCVCVHKNVVLKKAAGIELFLLNRANVLEDFTIESTALRPCTVTAGELVMKNGRIFSVPGRNTFVNTTKKSTIENVIIADTLATK